MPQFGDRSREAMSTSHTDIQDILNIAIRVFDFSVLCGFRGKEKQDEYFYATPQKSKKQWPNSVHNTFPSMAIDVAPYPIDWDDSLAFARLFGIVEAVAFARGYRCRWGGDWDQDGESDDQSFMDIGHIEFIKIEEPS